MTRRMSKIYATIDEGITRFIKAQKMFFVASAPLAATGHINLSPKGLDSFRILGPKEVAYLDFTGSGVETIAHLRENGRVVIMFCALEGPPKIIRLHGRGKTVEPGDSDFAAMRSAFPAYPGVRAVIVVEVERIADSCGYAVPVYRYEGERDQLVRWAENKGPDGVVDYQSKNNLSSIDGLPGLRAECLKP
jgi:hypothetical protein